MTQADYDEASKAALSLFEYGQVLKYAILLFPFLSIYKLTDFALTMTISKS